LEYNEATRKAFGDVFWKYVFTAIPIGLTIGGAALVGSVPGLVVATAAGLVQLTRFWKFDRKPMIDNGDLDAAAIVKHARKEIKLNGGRARPAK
jgi:hypothetical protein